MAKTTARVIATVAVLTAALTLLFERHEILRTGYTDDAQVIAPPAPVAVPPKHTALPGCSVVAFTLAKVCQASAGVDPSLASRPAVAST